MPGVIEHPEYVSFNQVSPGRLYQRSLKCVYKAGNTIK
jgi:hypothetical protein